MADTTSEQIGSNRANWYQFDHLAMCTAVLLIAVLLSLPKWLEPETAITIYRALLGAILGRLVWGNKGLFLGAVLFASFPFEIEERSGCVISVRPAFFEASIGTVTATVYLVLLSLLRSLGIRGWG